MPAASRCPSRQPAASAASGCPTAADGPAFSVFKFFAALAVLHWQSLAAVPLPVAPTRSLMLEVALALAGFTAGTTQAASGSASDPRTGTGCPFKLKLPVLPSA